MKIQSERVRLNQLAGKKVFLRQKLFRIIIMEKQDLWQEEQEKRAAKSERAGGRRDLESALNVETPAPVRGDMLRDSMDIKGGKNMALFWENYGRVPGIKKKDAKSSDSADPAFSIVSSGNHFKKQDVRSSMATNTTAYTQGVIKSARGADDAPFKRKKGVTALESFQRYSKAYANGRKDSMGAVTARQRYTQRNSLKRLTSGKRLVAQSSTSKISKQETFDTSRKKSPRNNMLDCRNGPADHEIGSLIGFKKIISNMPNSPLHGFGRQNTGRSQVQKDDSRPGAQSYSPDKLKVLSCTPRASIGKSPRFVEDGSVFAKNFINLPHAYQDNVNKQPRKDKMGVIGRDKRFKLHSDLVPGPGDYNPDSLDQLSARAARTQNNKLNHTHHGNFMSRSFSKKGSSKRNVFEKASLLGDSHLFGTHYNKMHYFPEIDKDFMNREGPGPAKYDLFSKISHGPGIQHSFGKTSRKIELKANHDQPGPNSYKHEKYAQRVLSQYPVATRVPIGKADRNFDIRNYGAINALQWSKGLIM